MALSKLLSAGFARIWANFWNSEIASDFFPWSRDNCLQQISTEFIGSFQKRKPKKPSPNKLGGGREWGFGFQRSMPQQTKFPMKSEFMLGTAQLESSSAEREPAAPGGHQADHEIAMPLQQRRLTVTRAALSKVLPADHARPSILSSEHWWGDTWSCVSSSELPSAG